MPRIIIWTSVRGAWLRWQANRLERAVFRELMDMEPHLLDDMGLSINDVATALEQRRTRSRRGRRHDALADFPLGEKPHPSV